MIFRSRFGFFSYPLPLTVGDDSTYYDKLSKDFGVDGGGAERERHEVGRVKQVITNPSRGTMDTFEKLKSNAIGDTYVDPGQYFLRKSVDGRPGSSGSVFRPSGCNKKVRRSEFQHLHNGPPQRPQPEKKTNFLARSTLDLFQQRVPYTEDLYENKDDVKRSQYILHREKILNLQRPYTSTVRQRGTFYSEKLTFGSDRDFPNVKSPFLTRK